ncbi:unnamed protein product, partial [Allacma fusca]
WEDLLYTEKYWSISTGPFDSRIFKMNCCAWRGSRGASTDGKSWSKHGGGIDGDDYPGHDPGGGIETIGREESGPNLQHISEREPDDLDKDPSVHPSATTLFIEKSKRAIQNGMIRKKSMNQIHEPNALKKSSSCSTIFLDDSTVSQPNLKNTLKCLSLAIYYHIRNRSSHRELDIFDERLHPLSKDGPPPEIHNPEHRQIYRFVRTLFNAAQLTAECAIIALVYLERLLTYAEMDIMPSNWRRMVLGSVLLASKVWDDQAVWNVDYCHILKDISVEDMNELERQCLELLQFNINVPSSVYAKYYFDLRTLAEANDLTLPPEPLSKERAMRLEAMSNTAMGRDKSAGPATPDASGLSNGFPSGTRRWSSLEALSGGPRRTAAILS